MNLLNHKKWLQNDFMCDFIFEFKGLSRFLTNTNNKHFSK